MWVKKSSYFSSLEENDQQKYIEKLTLQSLKLLPDPFNVDDTDWNTDVTKLPDIHYPDICNYLLETPSEYTRDKLKAYKSLEAYNFFVSGHVHEVYIHHIKNSSFSFVKTKVLPSQRQGQKQTLYEVWVTLHTTGWVLSANCTCMAGSVINFEYKNIFHVSLSKIIIINKV